MRTVFRVRYSTAVYAGFSIGASMSKRPSEKIDDSISFIADDEDQPPLTRHKVEAISHINSLIRKVKAEQADVKHTE